MTVRANELVRAVRTGERIKRIIGISNRVRSIATNAFLLAHRAGNLARGIGVSSNELRDFSEQVTAQMAVLGDVAFRLVAEVSARLRVSHRTRLLPCAHANLDDKQYGAVALASVLARHFKEREAGGAGVLPSFLRQLSFV